LRLRLKVYSSHYALDAMNDHRVSGTGISDLLSGTHRDESRFESFQRDRHLRWLEAGASD